MTQEQLRMQMLAGIITESQYKKTLDENTINDVISLLTKKEPTIINNIKSHLGKNPESTEEDIKQFIKDDGYELIQSIVPPPSKYSGDWRAEGDKYKNVVNKWAEDVYSRFF